METPITFQLGEKLGYNRELIELTNDAAPEELEERFDDIGTLVGPEAPPGLVGKMVVFFRTKLEGWIEEQEKTPYEVDGRTSYTLARVHQALAIKDPNHMDLAKSRHEQALKSLGTSEEDEILRGRIQACLMSFSEDEGERQELFESAREKGNPMAHMIKAWCLLHDQKGNLEKPIETLIEGILEGNIPSFTTAAILTSMKKDQTAEGLRSNLRELIDIATTAGIDVVGVTEELEHIQGLTSMMADPSRDKVQRNLRDAIENRPIPEPIELTIEDLAAGVAILCHREIVPAEE